MTFTQRTSAPLPYVWRDVLAGAYVTGVASIRRHLVQRASGLPVCNRVRAASLADVWSLSTPPCQRCLAWARRAYAGDFIDQSNGLAGTAPYDFAPGNAARLRARRAALRKVDK